jgi:hypothetical protein
MFKRALEVKVVKTKKGETPAADKTDCTYEGKVAIVGHYLDGAIKKIGFGIIAYVVADTFRQVLVAHATRS